jgi:ribosomal-protein-alanine N-acetyltransferase
MIRIRQAEPRDIRSIARLQTRVFGRDAIPSRSLRYHIHKRQNPSFVMEYQGEVIANALLCSAREKDTARLYSLAVAQDHAGRGLGRALLVHVLHHALASGRKRAHLEVRADNRAAIRLYERLGFKQDCLLPEFYSDGAPAYRMSADLVLRADVEADH